MYHVLQDPPLLHQNAGHFRNYYLTNQAVGNKKLDKNEKFEPYQPTVNEITDFYLKNPQGMTSIRELYERPIRRSRKEEEKELHQINNELQLTYQKIMQNLLSQATLVSSKSSSNPIPLNNKNLKQTQSNNINEKSTADPRKIRSQNTYVKPTESLKKINKNKSSISCGTISRKSANDESVDNIKFKHAGSSKNLFADYSKTAHQNLMNISSNLSTMLQESCAGIDDICQKVRLCLLDASVSYQFSKMKLENANLSLPVLKFANTNTKDMNTLFRTAKAYEKADNISDISVIIEEQEQQNEENHERVKKRAIEEDLDKEPHKETVQDRIKDSGSLKSIKPFFTILNSKPGEALTKAHKYEEYLTESMKEIEKIRDYDNFMKTMVEEINNEIKNSYKECPGGTKNKKDEKTSKQEKPSTEKSEDEENAGKDNKNKDNDKKSESRLQTILQNEDDLSDLDLSPDGTYTGQRRGAQVFEKTDFSIPDVYRKRAITNLHRRMVAQLEANDSFIFFQRLMKNSQEGSRSKSASVKKSKTDVKNPEKKQRSTNDLLKKYENSLWFKRPRNTKKHIQEALEALKTTSKNEKKWQRLLPQSYSAKSSSSLSQKSGKSRKGGTKIGDDMRSHISLSRKGSKLSKGSISSKSCKLQITNDKPLTEAERCRSSWMRVKYSQMSRRRLKYMDILDDISKKDLVPLNAEYPRRNEEPTPKTNIRDSLLYKITHDKNTEDAWSLLLASTMDNAGNELDRNDSQMTINDVDEDIYDEKIVKKSVSQKSSRQNHAEEKDKIGDLAQLLKSTAKCPESNCRKCSQMTVEDVIYEEEGVTNVRNSSVDLKKIHQTDKAKGDIAKKLTKIIFNSDEDIIKHQAQKVYTVMPAHVAYTNPPLISSRKNNNPISPILPLQPMKEVKDVVKRGEWTESIKKFPKPMKVIYDPVLRGVVEKEDRHSARQMSTASKTQVKIAHINSWSPKNFSHYCVPPPQVAANPGVRINNSSVARKHSPSISSQASKAVPVSPELLEIFRKASNAVAGLKKASPKMYQAQKGSEDSSPKSGISNRGKSKKSSPPAFMFDMDLIPKKDPKNDAKAKRDLEKMLHEDKLSRAKSPEEKKIWERKFGKTIGQKLINFIENQPDKYEIPTPKYAQPKTLIATNPTLAKVSKQQAMLNQLRNLKNKNCNIQLNIEKAISVIENKMVDILSKPALSSSMEAFDEMEKEITCALNSMKNKSDKKSLKPETIQEPEKEEGDELADQLLKRLEKILDTSSMSSFKDQKQQHKNARKSKSNVNKKAKDVKNDITSSASTSNEKVPAAPRKRIKNKSNPTKEPPVKDTCPKSRKSFPQTPKSPKTAVEKSLKNSRHIADIEETKNTIGTKVDDVVGEIQSYMTPTTKVTIDNGDTELANNDIQGQPEVILEKTDGTNQPSEIDTTLNMPIKNDQMALISEKPKSIYQAHNIPQETIVNMAIIERSSPQDSPGGDLVSERKSLEDEELTISNGLMGDQGDQIPITKEDCCVEERENKAEEEIKVVEEKIEVIEEETELKKQKLYSDSTYLTVSEGPTKSNTTVFSTPQWSPVMPNRDQKHVLVKKEIAKMKATEVVSDEEIDKIEQIQKEITHCILNLEESMTGQGVKKFTEKNVPQCLTADDEPKVSELENHSNLNAMDNVQSQEFNIPIDEAQYKEESSEIKSKENQLQTKGESSKINSKDIALTANTSKIQAIGTQSRNILEELDEVTEGSTPSFYDQVNKIISRVENVYCQLEEFEDELQADFSESVKTLSSEKSKNSFYTTATTQKSKISVSKQQSQMTHDTLLQKPYMHALEDLKMNNLSRPESPKTPKTKCQRSPSFYNVLKFLDTLTESRESYTAIEVRTVRLVYFATVVHYPITFYQSCVQYIARHIPASIHLLLRKPTKSCLKKTPSQEQAIRRIDFTKDKEKLDKIRSKQKTKESLEKDVNRENSEDLRTVRIPKVSFHIMHEEKSTQATICPYHSAQAVKIISKHQLELMLDKPPTKKDIEIGTTLDTVEDKSVDAILTLNDDDSTFENTESILEETDYAILKNQYTTGNHATDQSDTNDELPNEKQEFFQELGESSTPIHAQNIGTIKEVGKSDVKVFYDNYQESSSLEKSNSPDSQVTKVEGSYDENTINQVKQTLSREKDLSALRRKESLEVIKNHQNIEQIVVRELYKAAQLLEPLRNLTDFIDSNLLKEAIETRQKLRMVTRKSSTDLLKEMKRKRSTESVALNRCNRSTMTTRQEGILKGIYVFVYLVVFTALNIDYKCI